MARPQVVDEGNGLQIWRVSAIIFNKQTQTVSKKWSSRLGVGRGANNSWQKIPVEEYYTRPLTWTDILI
jgi:hypothetical protein